MEDLFNLNNLLINEDDENNLTEGEEFNPFSNNEDSNEGEDAPFNEENEETQETPPEENKGKVNKVAEENNKSPEGVGNEDDNNTEGEESTFTANNGTSPNVYSSIAKVLQEEGTFPDLNKDDLESINDASSFIEVIQSQIKNSIDEEYQRIDAALSIGIKPDIINSHRNTIKYLESLDEDTIRDENNEDLRKNLILQDLCNKGYSKERAEKTYQKSLDRGEDADDAVEALQANKEYFQSKYNELLDRAKDEEAKQIAAQKERASKFKKSIMEDKNLYGDFEVPKKMREEIYDSLTKPIYTDKETGNTYTAIQKWQLDDPETFSKALGLVYKLTNGGKDFNNLFNREVKKKVSKARSEFEEAVKGATYNEGGRLRLANAHNTDGESFLKGFTLDL